MRREKQNKRKKHAPDYEYLAERIKNLTDEKISITIPEYSEKYRVFGQPFPGPHRYDRTPYAYEIALELSPQSSTEIINIEKAAQMGLTANTTESLILYKIGADPGDILVMCPNEQFIKKWDESRIMPMIENSGFKNKLRSTYKKNTQHGGNGDSTGKKSWAGGRLDMLSFSQVNQLRNQSYQIIIMEDAEERVSAIKKGVEQGDLKKIAIVRTMAYEGRRKILDISTPLLMQGSAIHKAFLEGDQRYYYISCPHCQKMQRLIWKNLKYEKDEHNKIIESSVHYECDSENHCKIEEKYKPEFLLCEHLGGKAKWVPHNPDGANAKTKSYQISALYAGPGMIRWPQLAQEWLEAQGDPEALQTFINLRLGEPFSDYSDAPPAETLHILKGTYKKGELPNEKEGSPIIAMLGCDVQAGNERDGKYVQGKEPRIEASLWGFGLNRRAWLIDHYIFYGEVTDYRSGAFVLFRDAIVKKQFPIMPIKTFIDSRYQTDEVRKFCDRSNNIYPIMGESSLKRGYFNRVDLPGFRSGDGSPLSMYELNTNPIKRRIYNALALRRDPLTGIYPDGFIMFPIDLEHKYLEQLTSERPRPKEKNGKIIGYEWIAHGANEALDCTSYAFEALEAHIFEISQLAGEEASNYTKFWEFSEKKYGRQVGTIKK
jgi:phage terminase large subunit GpA-like protein